MAKILVVEDDERIAQTVKEYLTSQLHDVQVTGDGAEGASRLRHYTYDLIILDWGLPNLDGMTILKDMRGQGSKTPVLMLTGKSEINDKEAGLDGGADDYLTKPFHVRELAARVAALLRRPAPLTTTVIELGCLKLDPTARQIYKDNVPLKLSPYEFAILEYLMANPGRIVSPEEILRTVWGQDSDTTVDTLRTHLNRLRTKLEGKSGQQIIQNIYGSGYKLNL